MSSCPCVFVSLLPVLLCLWHLPFPPCVAVSLNTAVYLYSLLQVVISKRSVFFAFLEASDSSRGLGWRGWAREVARVSWGGVFMEKQIFTGMLLYFTVPQCTIWDTLGHLLSTCLYCILVFGTGRCYAMLCCVVVCCALQRCASLCTAVQCIALDRTALCTVRYCTVLDSTVLFCTALYCIALHCTVLHCNVLYYDILHCTVLYSTLPRVTVLLCPALS